MIQMKGIILMTHSTSCTVQEVQANENTAPPMFKKIWQTSLGVFLPDVIIILLFLAFLQLWEI